MIIRQATIEQDALAIFEGAQDFIQRTSLSDLLSTDTTVLQGVLGRLLSMDGVIVFVAEHEGTVVAGLGLLLIPYIWNPEVTIADELFWWASRDAPQRAAHNLFTTALAYCETEKAVPIFRALLNSPAGVTRLYKKKGLRPAEITFIGER